MTGDRITFVGSTAEARKLAGKETRVIDLAGKTVLPGLTDAHCHIFGIGEREMNLNLEGTNTRDEFLAKVKERVAQAERGKWITGRGWIETFWDPPQFPTAADLDAIAPDNPMFPRPRRWPCGRREHRRASHRRASPPKRRVRSAAKS